VKLNSGKLAIATILAAAAAAAGVAWWYQFQQGRRALAYWVADGAFLIRRASKVELMGLGDVSPSGEDDRETVFGRTVISRRNLARARGLVHARQALITDASFDWDSSAVDPSWEYAMRFADEGRETIIAFDLASGAARAVDQPAPLKLGPTLQLGVREFFTEQTTGNASSP
jgi:hypothetical protein